MEIQYKWFKGLWKLIRIVPVISWSGAGVMTTMFPILLFYKKGDPSTLLQTFYLLLGGVCIQGILAHAFNDLVDDESGTDHFTEGILSGGSRVLSSRLFSRQSLKYLACITLVLTLLIDGFLFWKGAMILAIVLLIGIWGAIAYSLLPFRLSYSPFIGEWLCAFVSITALSLTPALLTFHQLPRWALENACLHGLWSLSWLMYHHISDVDADRMAVPRKNTTVVFFDQRFQIRGKRKLPAIIYLLITALFTMMVLPVRPLGAGISLIFVLLAFITVILSDTTIPAHLAKSEMKLIALSIINALWLGCVPFN